MWERFNFSGYLMICWKKLQVQLIFKRSKVFVGQISGTCACMVTMQDHRGDFSCREGGESFTSSCYNEQFYISHESVAESAQTDKPAEFFLSVSSAELIASFGLLFWFYSSTVCSLLRWQSALVFLLLLVKVSLRLIPAPDPISVFLAGSLWLRADCLLVQLNLNRFDSRRSHLQNFYKRRILDYKCV